MAPCVRSAISVFHNTDCPPAPHGVMLLHFSKSSGTALCDLARENGCRTRGTNCANRRVLKDGPWWTRSNFSNWHTAQFSPTVGGRTSHRSCERRRRHYAAPTSFHAVESTLPDGQLCSGFFSVAVFRSPLARLESHSRDLVRWSLLPPGVRCDDYDALRTSFPTVYDNYHVRTLLGEAVWGAPLGTLNGSHLSSAVRALEQFHAVILAEAPDAAARVTSVLGLREGGFASAPPSEDAEAEARPDRCALPLASRLQALADNHLDVALYEVARRLGARAPRCRWRGCASSASTPGGDVAAATQPAVSTAAAERWLSTAKAAHCGFTLSHSGCGGRQSTKGAWTVAARHAANWTVLAAECLARCAACRGCKHAAISLHERECGWYAKCPPSRLTPSPLWRVAPVASPSSRSKSPIIGTGRRAKTESQTASKRRRCSSPAQPLDGDRDSK